MLQRDSAITSNTFGKGGKRSLVRICQSPRSGATMEPALPVDGREGRAVTARARMGHKKSFSVPNIRVPIGHGPCDAYGNSVPAEFDARPVKSPSSRVAVWDVFGLPSPMASPTESVVVAFPPAAAPAAAPTAAAPASPKRLPPKRTVSFQGDLSSQTTKRAEPGASSSVGAASSSTASSTVSTTTRCAFNVTVETQWGDSVVLCGSSEELGCWAPARGLRLETSPETYPVWRCCVELRGDSPVEYKVVRLRGAGAAAEWEPLPTNRRLELVPRPRRLACRLAWGAAQQTVVVDESLPLHPAASGRAARTTAPDDDHFAVGPTPSTPDTLLPPPPPPWQRPPLSRLWASTGAGAMAGPERSTGPTTDDPAVAPSSPQTPPKHADAAAAFATEDAAPHDADGLSAGNSAREMPQRSPASLGRA